MTGKKEKRIMAALLCALLVFGLCGCGGKPADQEVTDEPVDGGNTHRVDPDAPKVIGSKDITDLETSFFVATRWDSEENGFFRFTVRQAGGALTATEENRGISCPADGTLLGALQEIIDRYGLASQNGLYDVTAGLAPEYQPGGITVLYASGEKLTFTTDNNPYAMWAQDVYDVFAEWFAGNGIEELYPARETSQITSVRFRYMEDGLLYEYGPVNVQENNAIDGETHLLEKEIYDNGKEDTVFEAYMLIPEDYFAQLTAIVEKTDLDRNYMFSSFNHKSLSYDNHDLGFFGMGNKVPDYSEPDSEDMQLTLHLAYESGHRINIDTRKASEIEGMRPIIDALIAYHDSLFE